MNKPFMKIFAGLVALTIALPVLAQNKKPDTKNIHPTPSQVAAKTELEKFKSFYEKLKTPKDKIQRIDELMAKYYKLRQTNKAKTDSYDFDFFVTLNKKRQLECEKDPITCANPPADLLKSLCSININSENFGLESSIWRSIFSALPDAKSADAMYGQVKNCGEQSSLGKFVALQELLLAADKKLWLSTEKQILNQLYNEWKTSPTPFTPYMPIITKYADELSLIAPIPMTSLKTLYSLTTSHAKDIDFASLPDLLLEPWLKGGAQTLARTGQGASLADLIQSHPEWLTKDRITMALNIAAPLCFYWRDIQKLNECRNLLSTIKTNPKASEPEAQRRLATENAWLTMASGQFSEALKQFGAVRTLAEQAGNKAALPWIHMAMCETEMHNNNLVNSQKHLDIYKQTIGSSRDPLLVLVAPHIQTSIYLLGQRYDEAQKEVNFLVATLPKKLNGVMDLKAWIKLHQLMLAVAHKKTEAPALHTELSNMVKVLPSFNYIQSFADATLNISKGTYQPSNLDGARKILGSKNLNMLKYSKIIEQINTHVNKKP